MAFSGRGVILTGASGSGKSSTALQLIALGAELVGDDQLLLQGDGDELRVAAPAPLRGLIEARFIGILRLPHIVSAKPVLVVDLDATCDQRLPQRRNTVINSLRLPLIAGKNVPNLVYAVAAWIGSTGDADMLDPEKHTLNDARQ